MTIDYEILLLYGSDFSEKIAKIVIGFQIQLFPETVPGHVD